MDQRVLLPGGFFGAGHSRLDVGDVADQRRLCRVAVGRMEAEDEDRYAVVMIAGPAAGDVEGSPLATTAPVPINS